jgi:hypothetical protein
MYRPPLGRAGGFPAGDEILDGLRVVFDLSWQAAAFLGRQTGRRDDDRRGCAETRARRSDEMKMAAKKRKKCGNAASKAIRPLAESYKTGALDRRKVQEREADSLDNYLTELQPPLLLCFLCFLRQLFFMTSNVLGATWRRTSWAIRIDDAQTREVAELQILVPEPVAKRWWEGVETMAISAGILKFGITAPEKRKFEKIESSIGSTVSNPGQAGRIAHEEHQVTRRAKRPTAPGKAEDETKCRCAHPRDFDLNFLSFLNSPAFQAKTQVVAMATGPSSSISPRHGIMCTPANRPSDGTGPAAQRVTKP